MITCIAAVIIARGLSLPCSRRARSQVSPPAPRGQNGPGAVTRASRPPGGELPPGPARMPPAALEAPVRDPVGPADRRRRVESPGSALTEPPRQRPGGSLTSACEKFPRLVVRSAGAVCEIAVLVESHTSPAVRSRRETWLHQGVRSEREHDIVTWVDDQGRVSLGALAERFGVSEMTIRRDLDALTAAGRLLRVRGGAERLPSPGEAPRGSTAGLAGAAGAASRGDEAHPPRPTPGAVIRSGDEDAPAPPPSTPHTTSLPADSPTSRTRWPRTRWPRT